MKAEQQRQSGAWDRSWLMESTAALACVLGVAGVIAFLAHSAWAEAPRNGFQPGARTFSNPFVNSGAPSAPNRNTNTNNFFDDDQPDDSGDFGDSGNSAPPVNSGNPVSMGGSQGNSGLISHAKVPSIQVNDETGKGINSNAVVTDFNFPDADILDIAKTLGRLTGKNFILDKDVKGRITIISNSPITVADAWRAFLTALDINQFALIPSGKYIRIARQRDARDKQLKTYTGQFSPDTDALITRVFPLKYINSEEVARNFRSFMPAGARIIPYEQTNTVIVTDTGANISKLAQMLKILDIEGYHAGIEVVAVKYASAVELSKLIDTLIPGTGSAPGQPASHFGGGFGSASHFTARRTKEGGIINTILADERTNTLIINANTKGADQVRALVQRLDQKVPAPTGGGKVHVYYLQFADAEAVSTTLNNLTSAGATGTRPIPPSGTGGGGVGINPNASTLFEGAIKVAPDKATNSLVVTASPADYATIERVIGRLDIRRDEIYVEVVIMEIDLDRQFNYSSSIINPSSGLALVTNSDLFTFLTNPASATGAILSLPAGKSTTINIPNGQPLQVSSVLGLIRAIQANTSAHVLATPQIIALDNTEAVFVSSDNIPIPTTTVVQGGAVSSSVTTQRVELSLKITPHINKLSNFVRLDVDAKLSDISGRPVPKQLQDVAFATTERDAKTSVVVGDQDTVVLGGMIRDKITESVSKIPLLGDIPVLGWLFKSKSTEASKSNLVIFMTPHIVRQYERIRALLDKKLKERDDFIEQNADGVDPLRGTRDNIIRSLPDVKQLESQKPNASVDIGDEENSQSEEDRNNMSPFTGGESRSQNIPPNRRQNQAQGEPPGATPPGMIPPPTSNPVPESANFPAPNAAPPVPPASGQGKGG